jgi:uncharacterized protein YchJ
LRDRTKLRGNEMFGSDVIISRKEWKQIVKDVIKHRESQCPCGSGKKIKECHGKPDK